VIKTLRNDICKTVQRDRQEKLKTVAYIGYYLLFFIFYGGKYLLDAMGKEAVILEYILLLLAYVCLGIKILMTEYTQKEAACGLGLLVLAAVSFIFNKNEYLVTNVILLLSLKDIDLEEMFRQCFWVGLFSMLMTMLWSIETELGGGYRSSRGWLEADTIRMRYSFGFSTPNTCHMYLWRLEMLYIFGNYSKIRLPHIAVMMALNVVLYQFTVSRTGFLGTMLLVFYLGFIKIAEPLTEKRSYGIILAAVYIIFGALVCYLVFGKPNADLFWKLDGILSKRLSLAVERAEWIPPSFFGNHYVSDYNYIDCGWVSMLLQWGGLWFVLYNAAMIALILKGTRDKKPQLAMVVLISGIYGFGESSVMEKGVASISVLVIAELLYRRTGKQVDKIV
jgi:hypothetical protein